MKLRFSILALLVATSAIALWLSRLDRYGELIQSASHSTCSDRAIRVTYFVRPGRWEHVEDKLELVVIQTGWLDPNKGFSDSLGEINYRYDSFEKINAIKIGELEIAVPPKHQFHEIFDGEYASLETNLTKDEAMEFVSTFGPFPRLSQMPESLDEHRIANDVDGDGVLDAADWDTDNDGISDLVERGDPAWIAVDADGDGAISGAEASVAGLTDNDSDGIWDQLQKGVDTDGDGVQDIFDLDSDNDGVSDLVESGDAIAIAADTDGDGKISLDEGQAAGLTRKKLGGAFDQLGNQPVDSDGDGVADFRDAKED